MRILLEIKAMGIHEENLRGKKEGKFKPQGSLTLTTQGEMMSL